jgi:metal-sulfur cluster biosynthetic enzyme
MSENPSTPSNHPVWDAEADHPALCEALRTAFYDVLDPELGLNIIQLGLIRNVTIENDHAIVRMILTTPFCPYGPAMIDVTQKKAEEALGRPVNIDLGMDVWDFSMMDDDVRPDWSL